MARECPIGLPGEVNGFTLVGDAPTLPGRGRVDAALAAAGSGECAQRILAPSLHAIALTRDSPHPGPAVRPSLSRGG